MQRGDIMKKIVTGLSLILSGGLFYFNAFIVGALNVSNTTGWDASMGRFWSTISEYRLLLPIWFGIILIISGILFLFWEVFEDKICEVIRHKNSYNKS